MPLLNPQEHKSLHKKYKRLMWFIGVGFIFALVLCYLLMLAGLHPVLNGFILICVAGVSYLLFLWICAKIDKKKEAKAESDKNRDPFRH